MTRTGVPAGACLGSTATRPTKPPDGCEAAMSGPSADAGAASAASGLATIAATISAPMARSERLILGSVFDGQSRVFDRERLPPHLLPFQIGDDDGVGEGPGREILRHLPRPAPE